MNQPQPDAITIDDRYISATHASNLRLEADKPGPLDVVIAVGWCKQKLYGAMTRLFSEYDGVSHPKPMSAVMVGGLAQTLDSCKKVIGLERAQIMADSWYAQELVMMMMRLKSLPAIRHELTYQAGRMGIESPREVAVAVIMWMLDDVCDTCHGAIRDVAKNEAYIPKPIVCPTCRGSGKKKMPYGDSGRDLVGYIQEIMGDARNSTKKRLSRFK